MNRRKVILLYHLHWQAMSGYKLAMLLYSCITMPDQVPAQIFMSHHKHTAVAAAILLTNTLLINFFT